MLDSNTSKLHQPPYPDFAHRYLCHFPFLLQSFSDTEAAEARERKEKEHKSNDKKVSKTICASALPQRKTSAMVQLCQGGAPGRASTQIPKPTATHIENKKEEGE